MSQVEDVVGYDTLGHCFFLEDGNELDNKLIHNLALLTKPGSLLPADRSDEICQAVAKLPPNDKFKYKPDSQRECMLAHFSTTLIQVVEFTSHLTWILLVESHLFVRQNYDR